MSSLTKSAVPASLTLTVYVTKYALTRGILTVTVQKEPEDDLVTVTGVGPTQYYHRGEWHTTFLEAAMKARKMRDARVLALKKQVKKLSGMKFEVPGE